LRVCIRKDEGVWKSPDSEMIYLVQLQQEQVSLILCPLRTKVPIQLRIPEPMDADGGALWPGNWGRKSINRSMHAAGRDARWDAQRIVPYRPCDPRSTAFDRLKSAAVCGCGLAIVDCRCHPGPAVPCLKLLHVPSSFAGHKRAAVVAHFEKSWILKTPTSLVSNW
jgi:hypothetical protein